jgi:hypothetical protein
MFIQKIFIYLNWYRPVTRHSTHNHKVSSFGSGSHRRAAVTAITGSAQLSSRSFTATGLKNEIMKKLTNRDAPDIRLI